MTVWLDRSSEDFMLDFLQHACSPSSWNPIGCWAEAFIIGRSYIEPQEPNSLDADEAKQQDIFCLHDLSVLAKRVHLAGCCLTSPAKKSLPRIESQDPRLTPLTSFGKYTFIRYLLIACLTVWLGPSFSFEAFSGYGEAATPHYYYIPLNYYIFPIFIFPFCSKSLLSGWKILVFRRPIHFADWKEQKTATNYRKVTENFVSLDSWGANTVPERSLFTLLVARP